jgi:hypothetical protein
MEQAAAVTAGGGGGGGLVVVWFDRRWVRFLISLSLSLSVFFSAACA